MKKLLKKDGIVIVEVPNFPKIVEKIPFYAVFHQHISMFTRSTLIYLFTRQGFKLKKILEEKRAKSMQGNRRAIGNSGGDQSNLVQFSLEVQKLKKTLSKHKGSKPVYFDIIDPKNEFTPALQTKVVIDPSFDIEKSTNEFNSSLLDALHEYANAFSWSSLSLINFAAFSH